MADKEPKVKTFDQYHDEIEKLKLKRIDVWRKLMPDTTDMSNAEARRATIRAENSPEVMAIQGEIAILREEQLSHHEEPTVDPGLSEAESDESHVAHGHAPRFGTIKGHPRTG